MMRVTIIVVTLLFLSCLKGRDVKLSGPSISVSKCEEDKEASIELECRCVQVNK